MIQILKQYFKSPLLLKTYSIYNNICENAPDYPYYNYFGINFNSNGITSVKFYFHVFQRINEHEVLLFIPTTKEFNIFYPFYEESQSLDLNHLGCAFELKFHNTETPIYGFHFRLKPCLQTEELIGFPKKIPILFQEYDLYPGINFEYFPNYTVKKKYYYFNKSEYKAFFSKKFNLPLINKTRFIEYSESDKFSKINTWYGNNPELFLKANLFPIKQKHLINFLCSEYSLDAKVFGYYENSDIKSVYFFDSIQKKIITSSKRQTHLDTIKKIINDI
jgi:hypothetical protein